MLYSVIIPVFNSEKIVEKTVLRVLGFFASYRANVEIILVNDGSSDGSWQIISELAREYDSVSAINLLKNYGQHSANMCGFRKSRGDYVVTMDDDLQNPPEEIAKLIEKAEDGFDLVLGRFETKKHSSVRKIGSKVVGWINRKAFDIQKDLVLSNFRIIRRDVVDRVCRDDSSSPYIPGLVLKYSSNRCNVLVKHLPRAVGGSSYTMAKLFKMVANILFNHSTMPLRSVAMFGFVSSFISFSLGVFFIANTLIDGVQVSGWASLVVLMSFFNGILMLLLSVIGEYLIRVLREINPEQSYEVIEEIP